MDANQLLFYLRGMIESTETLSTAQISNLRLEVLRAQPVEAKIIPVEVVNPMTQVQSRSRPCGCSGQSVDATKL